MKCHVFLGPSLPLCEAKALLPDAVFHPPAAMGDVYRVAAARGCGVIALIDGVFGQVAAVWHKEILFALERGIRVLGAASMGALRACELCAFGMEGAGYVYQWYASGAIEDDDEVALAHGPAALGYPALSVPMVNVRRALHNATADGLLDGLIAERVAEQAKAVHFIDRTWVRIGAAAVAAGVARTLVDRLLSFAGDRRHDVKRADAASLLRLIAAAGERELRPVATQFERTVFWDRFVDIAHIAPDGDDVSADELRRHAMLTSEDCTLLDGARLAVLAEREARRQGAIPTTDALQEELNEFRRARGLLSRAELDRWLDSRHLTLRDFAKVVRRAMVIRAAVAPSDEALDGAFKLELQRTGRFAEVRRDVAERRRYLALRGIVSPTLAECGLDERSFLDWYRRRFRLRDEESLEGHAATLGFSGLREFVAEALSQYLWERDGGGTARGRMARLAG